MTSGKHKACVALTALACAGLSLNAQDPVVPGQPAEEPVVDVAEAEDVLIRRGGRTLNVVVPQMGRVVAERREVVLESVRASIDIGGAIAETRLTLSLHNPTGRPLESQVMVPVPHGAAIRGFGYGGSTPDGYAEFTAELVESDAARATYQSIVRTMRDPGLLEYMGHGLVKSSVFPIPAGETVEAWITYEEPVELDGGRLDYALPRSAGVVAAGVEWAISARIRSDRPIDSIYSPTHQIVSEEAGENTYTVSLDGGAVTPGTFRLSAFLGGEGGGPSIVLYPEPGGLVALVDPGGADAESGVQYVGGGFFMISMGAPDVDDLRPEGPLEGEQAAIRREVTLVLDRSGSMNGEKFEQARAAALQVLSSLLPGERFNVIDYSDNIESFAEIPVEKTAETMAQVRAYLGSLDAGGGTNIHDALQQAVSAPPTEGMLPVVLFLTDGKATTGITGEREIREAIAEANAHERRIFSFGVGYDVNVPLLDTLARTSRATTAFVGPGEDVEATVSDVFEKLRGPVLASPTITITERNTETQSKLVRSVLPDPIPDVFAGERLMIFGRYTRAAEGTIRLTAQGPSGEVFYDVPLETAKADPDNGYVARLWATRRIAELTDRIRDAGADRDATQAVAENQELVDEIIRLSLEHGIMTRYTSFLATEDNARFAYERVTPDALSVIPAYRAQIQFDLQAADVEAEIVEDNLNRSGAAGVAINSLAQRQRQAEQVEVIAVTGTEGVGFDLDTRFYSDYPDSWPRITRMRFGGLEADDASEAVYLATVQQLDNDTFFNYAGNWVDARILNAAFDEQKARAGDAEEGSEDADEGVTIEPDRVIVFASDAYFELADRLAADGRADVLAQPGEVFVMVDDEVIHITDEEPEAEVGDAGEGAGAADEAEAEVIE